MQPVLKIAVLTASLVLVSCNSTVIKYSTDYTTREKLSSCAVIIPDIIDIDYQGDVENEFGKGDNNELIAGFFRSQFRKEIASRTVFDTVFTSAAISNNYLRQGVELKTRKGMKTFYLPSVKEKLECQSIVPDIVLALDEIEISSHFDMSVSSGYYSGGMNYGPSFSSSKDLIITAKFLIWDNLNSKLISYGFVEAIDKNRFAVSMEDWLEAVSDAASKMLEQTSFRKGF